MTAAIARVHGRRVWDSRGRPTVEAEVVLQGGAIGRAIAPAGASRGSREAFDLRDGGPRFGGMDVTRAITNIETLIAPALAGRDALELFLARPEIGFVWLASTVDADAAHPVGACVVCYAISTSRGTLVAKLDDVTVAAGWQGRGVGQAMLGALAEHLRTHAITRIDTACHRDNAQAWRFYERLGFRPLDEERISLLL